MKTHKSYELTLRSIQGTAMAVVMIMSTATLLILASFVSTGMVQKRVNTHASLLAEARNAAEGVAEFAVAEITRRASAYSSGPTNPLLGYEISAADKDLLVPIDPLTLKPDPLVHTVVSSIEFKNSDLSLRPKNPLFISGEDPVYQSGGDPEIGKTEIVRSCNVFATASVKDPVTGKLISSYIAQNIQIREQSWFNYGVFYNMDLEFHAGPNFDMIGPVHTNENVYILQGKGTVLNFFNSVTAVKKILRQLKYDDSVGGFEGKVYCSSKAPGTTADLVEMKLDDNSLTKDWKTIATGKWDSKVRDEAFEVASFSPDGMPTYTPEDYTKATIELRNNAYLMIEPQLSNDPTDITIKAGRPGYLNGRYGQKEASTTTSPENLKFSALAGFTIRVNAAVKGTVPTWVLISYSPVSDSSRPIAKNNLPQRSSDGTPIVETVINPFGVDETEGGTPVITRRLKRLLLDAIVSIPYEEEDLVGGKEGTGTIVAYNASLPLDPTNPVPADDVRSYFAMYDRRQGFDYASGKNSGLKGAFNVLRINLDKLNQLVNNKDLSIWTMPGGGKAYDPSSRWTGIVYVEFPLAAIAEDRFPAKTANGDMIRRAVAPTLGTPGYALVLANAKVLPRLTPQAPDKRADGFTIATNGPAYILGHYNSDGDSKTGSSTVPDKMEAVPTDISEIPALVAADSVTVLSSAWAAADGYGTPVDPTKSYFRYSITTKPTASAFTEVSTAIITGLVPTRPGVDQIWSAGVHNFVRYQEKWSNRIYRYRGSLVALFESEVANAPFHENKHTWYDPPDRDMGYHQFLSEGWLPPGTPVRRGVRRMNLTDIYKAEYDANPTVPEPST